MDRNRNKRERKKNTGKKAAIIACSVLTVVIVAFAAVGIVAAKRTTVFPNVTVSGVELGGLTYDGAHSALLNSHVMESGEVSATVVLTDEVTITVNARDAGVASTVTEAADAAYNYGRDGNFFSNTFTFIGSLFSSRDVLEETSFDEEYVRGLIADTAAEVDHGVIEPMYTVTDTRLVLTKGTSGYTVDQEAVFEYIKATILSGTSGETEEFSAAENSQEAGTVDFDKIAQDVFTEPQNSVYDKENQECTESVDGVSLDIDAARLAYESADPGETVEVELIITEPEITKETLESYLFRDLITSKMTTMYSSSSNRINNITLAAAAINGTILNPGEEFSFNGIVGERTSAKGYKPAGAYVGGQSVDQIGGGICQVSSTIYYCALKADLEITDRTNHMYTVAYLPMGFDATVNWGTIDFKFKNDKDYPIKIVTYVQNKELYVEIWGTKLDDSYVELQYDPVRTIENETIETVDETLAPGEEVVEVSGHPGYVVDAYQKIYNGDGSLLESNYLSRDTYRKQDREVRVGPEEEETIGPGTDPTDPGTGTTDPGTGTTDPGAGTTDPGTGTTDPGNGVTDPGTGTTDPGTGTTDPGTETTDPGTGTPVSGSGTESA